MSHSIYMLQRKGFKSYNGPYYTRESAEAAGQKLKANKAWPNSDYRVIEFVSANVARRLSPRRQKAHGTVRQ